MLLPLSPSLGMLELMVMLMLGVGVELALARRLAQTADHAPLAPPWWRLLAAPLLRGTVLVAAVMCVYPALFGFRHAPALATVLFGEERRGALALVAIVLARLLAPALPPLCRRVGHVDSAQAILAVAVLFAGYADYLGARSASAWPGAISAFALLGSSMWLPALASGLGRDLGARWNSTLAQWLGELCGMLAVAPIVVLYGNLLGMQLAM